MSLRHGFIRCSVILAFMGAVPLFRPDLTLSQEAAPTALTEDSLKNRMQRVYEAFRQLQPYLYRREAFLDAKNEATIAHLLAALESGFHRDGFPGSSAAAEPGFATTLQVLNEMLDDARARFTEGRKSYALWRLKTSSNYCVSCHTRFEVGVDFFDATASLPGLDKFEQGEFFLATRQFERAAQAFLNAAASPTERFQRIDALRKWLIIYVRVHPDPAAALRELRRLESRMTFTEYEKQEVAGWIESLKRWQAEKPWQGSLVEQAEQLIRQAQEGGEPLLTRDGTVELLRATALLHRVVDGSAAASGQSLAHVLYLLGLAYAELPLYFVNELPELFLERAIREAPNSHDAREAYNLLRDLLVVGYTGSGGTQIPEDVGAQLSELHDLAFGRPRPARS